MNLLSGVMNYANVGLYVFVILELVYTAQISKKVSVLTLVLTNCELVHLTALRMLNIVMTYT